MFLEESNVEEISPDTADQPIAIERGQMEGRYFTQWRIDMLEELLHTVVYCYGTVPLVTVENAKVWYDDPNDFHMLSYDAAGNHIEVKLYKVFSSKINGVDGWVGCPKYNQGEFAKHLRDASR